MRNKAMWNLFISTVIVCSFATSRALLPVHAQGSKVRQCTADQLLTAFATVSEELLESDDAAVQLYQYFKGNIDQPPPSEQVSQQMRTALEELEKHMQTETSCFELVGLLSSRATLLSAYTVYSTLFDAIDLGDELRNTVTQSVLIPAAVSYVVSIENVKTKLEEAKQIDSETQSEMPSSSTTKPSGGPLWSASGKDDKKVSVEITFSPGIYRLNIVKEPAPNVDWGGIVLREIVDIPENCFRSIVAFPTQFRLKQNCHIYATFGATIFSDYERNPWEVSITKLD